MAEANGSNNTLNLERCQLKVNREIVWLSCRNLPLTVALSLMLTVVTLSAIVGNCLVCAAIVKNTPLRTVTNVFVFALAVSDILMALLVMPVSIVTVTRRQWLWDVGDDVQKTRNTFPCQVQGFSMLLLAGCSLHTMTLIAIHRYFCVIRPRLSKRLFTRKSAACVIALDWIVETTVLILVVCLSDSFFQFSPKRVICFLGFENPVIRQKLQILVTVFFFAVPTVMILLCYARVFWFVRQHNAAVAPSLRGPAGPNSTRTNNVAEAKTTRVLFVVLLGFLICWIPGFLLEVFRLFINTPREAWLYYSFMSACSSAVNPFIYAAMNQKFRTEFAKMLRCGRSLGRVHAQVQQRNLSASWTCSRELRR